MKPHLLFGLTGLLALGLRAQTILFGFDSAPLLAPLPITLTVGDVTAQLSATGQGFSIQPANTMGFTPAGFAGNCIYPSSVHAADLLVSFSTPLTGFSVLYAPQELACDSSATMRVTASLDGAVVGTATTNAQAGTWPSEILQLTSPQRFNRVVVHYDKPPVTGGDWGPIFMADNLQVTAAPPIVLTSPVRLPNGAAQFTFTNTPGAAFTVLVSTNLASGAPGWTNADPAEELSPGSYTFTDTSATNSPARFYRVSSP